MRLNKLLLRNFRAFSELEVNLHPELTVLVAPNGGGKTTVLDAISLALAPYVDALAPQTHPVHLRPSDVRRVVGADQAMTPVLPAFLHVDGVIAGVAAAWSHTLLDIDGRDAQSEPQPLLSALSLQQDVVDWAERRRPAPPLLPVVATYNADRLCSKGARLGDSSRFSGYEECLGAYFQFFTDWFDRLSREARAEADSGRASPHRPKERLAVVQRAVAQVLEPSGWTRLGWDFKQDQFVATHAKQCRFPVSGLSHGVRSMIGLVGDIAHRCTRLNPHLGERAAEETPGIVLIDDIDARLHPRWQRRVLADLRRAFPRIQLIATTQSPFIVQSLQPGQLVNLDPEATNQPYANRSIEDVTEGVMRVEVPQRSQRYTEMLKIAEEYYALLDRVPAASPDELAQLRASLDLLEEPFSLDMGFTASLRHERLLADRKPRSSEEPGA